MSMISFPFTGQGGLEPRYRTTASATGRLLDDVGGAIEGATGLFTLRRGAALLVENRTMSPAPHLGTGYARCAISAAEMGVRGAYHWEMILLTPGGEAQWFTEGQFTI